jgi:hypothetical protein
VVNFNIKNGIAVLVEYKIEPKDTQKLAFCLELTKANYKLDRRSVVQKPTKYLNKRTLFVVQYNKQKKSL